MITRTFARLLRVTTVSLSAAAIAALTAAVPATATPTIDLPGLLNSIGSGSSMPRTTAPVLYEKEIVNRQRKTYLYVRQGTTAGCYVIRDKKTGQSVIGTGYSMLPNDLEAEPPEVWQVSINTSRPGCDKDPGTALVVLAAIKQNSGSVSLIVDKDGFTCGPKTGPSSCFAPRTGQIVLIADFND